MEPCIYDKVDQQIYCCECLATEDLVMRALQKDGKLCGHVWMCQKCANQIAALDVEFTPIYKTTMNPVIAA